jgi:ketosteroid isomerase-like protein
MSFAALAAHHGSAEDEVRAASEAFDRAYATNDVEGYFGFYAEGATVYFSGARQDLSAYHEEWTAMMEAGGGVTRSPEGEVSTVRAFETDVWQKIDGEWKIISLHYSEIPAEE